MNFRILVQDVLRFGVVALILLLAFAGGLRVWGGWHDDWSGWNAQFTVSDGFCNIAIVPITGEIVGYEEPTYGDDGFLLDTPTTVADDVTRMIRTAEFDPYIEGILFRIDSGGGWPVASSVIADTINQSPLLSVALIRDIGTSGAYWAASAADAVIASAMSDVGSIGVTMSYLDYSGQNAKEGIRFVSLSSGPYKDAGYPDKPLTFAERVLFERDLKIAHDVFVEAVANNRGMSVEEIAALADGSAMPGTLALENGLIDAIGNQETAREWFADFLGLSPDEVAFCE